MPAQLLVEGPDDLYVISALCAQHSVPETFKMVESGGVEKLLESIPVRLKTSGLEALGIVVDADTDLQARWTAVCRHLQNAGYPDLPAQPGMDGVIVASFDRPRVGVWLMPDNSLPGMLENFVAHLIPQGDPLASKANDCMQDIEREGLARYSAAHRPKAFIHTWLAWQETPGRPMGQAITAHVLEHNGPLASRFVRWLNSLFNPGV